MKITLTLIITDYNGIQHPVFIPLARDLTEDEQRRLRALFGQSFTAFHISYQNDEKKESIDVNSR